MRVFRSKVGSWCALLALAVQLALSFGHVHRDEARLAPLGGGWWHRSDVAPEPPTLGRFIFQ